jgi:hypothetical protein
MPETSFGQTAGRLNGAEPESRKIPWPGGNPDRPKQINIQSIPAGDQRTHEPAVRFFIASEL